MGTHRAHEKSRAMNKLCRELAKEIMGDISESDLAGLPYLGDCLKETFKLHPPGQLLRLHWTVETCQVKGYTIPKTAQLWSTCGPLPVTLRFETIY